MILILIVIRLLKNAFSNLPYDTITKNGDSEKITQYLRVES